MPAASFVRNSCRKAVFLLYGLGVRNSGACAFNMNGRRWLWIGLTLVGVLLLVAFMRRGGEIPVRTEKAQRESIVNTISTNGKIEPVDNFEAHAPSGTTVKRLFVREGDRVKAGQKILQLDDATARADAARGESPAGAASRGSWVRPTPGTLASTGQSPPRAAPAADSPDGTAADCDR